MRTTGALDAGFPAFLRTRRQARCLTVQDLAALLGVGGHRIEAWERGSSRPARERWAHLANALGITVDELQHAQTVETAPGADLPTQLWHLTTAFLACSAGDRRALLRRADALARMRVVH